ncbi:threonine/serine exporter ThrE family protein [uncultured Arsenicicoccus sp.]|uniref:threonine/serine ThrE exporter family protein n=1 Tax=uncultured Arsenicicoccus sp. TaxID=491339 RepID=UPI002594DE25|nr:threonine/serine exporter family protein [uncultured Arsenicicoccus sp.]
MPHEQAAPSGAPDERQTRRLLVYLAAALVAGGMPVHEVEADVRRCARALGQSGCQLSALPTGVVLSLGYGSPATFEAVEGSLRLDQSAEVNVIQRGLEDGTVTATEALERLVTLRARPHRYDVPGMYAGGAFVAAGIALILQPSLRSVLFALVCSPLVVALLRVSGRHRLLTILFPSVAAFVVSLLAFWAGEHGLVPGPLRSLLPPLAVLLPGALIVTGLSELAAGAMVAGTSRLVYGASQLVLFGLGVGAAAVLLRVPPDLLANDRSHDLGWWAALVGLVVLTVGISLMEAVPPRLVPWVLLILAATFASQVLGQALVPSPWFGAFLGAVAASLGASAVELLRPRLPRLVVFLPSFWLLVPGSLGLMSVTQLGLDTPFAADTIALSVGVICAISVGLVVGSGVARGAWFVGRVSRSQLRQRAGRWDRVSHRPGRSR